MNKISQYDKNLRTEKINNDLFEFHSFREFVLEGFPWFETDQKLYRLPLSILPEIREHLGPSSQSSAGGCLRFKTNSPKIALKVTFEKIGSDPIIALSGTVGFDLYFRKNDLFYYEKVFRPEFNEDKICMVQDVQSSGDVDEYMLNFPSYSCPEDIQIGIIKGSIISADVPKHKIDKPILFYGSSITHGGCVSRPGVAYTNLVAREFDAELINIGFGGNAQGDQGVAKAIASLDLSLFVSEYDHNASLEHLRATHFDFIKIIRDANPNLPIILMTRPYFDFKEPQVAERVAVVRDTYNKLRESGDKNVYFINNMETFSMENRFDYSVDNVHPSDLGLRLMADTIIKLIKDNHILE